MTPELDLALHSEKVIKEHIANTVMLWSDTFKGKKFYRNSDYGLTLPKTVSDVEAFFHVEHGWCVSFRDDEYPSVSNLFKAFTAFIETYSCQKS